MILNDEVFHLKNEVFYYGVSMLKITAEKHWCM